MHHQVNHSNLKSMPEYVRNELKINVGNILYKTIMCLHLAYLIPLTLVRRETAKNMDIEKKIIQRLSKSNKEQVWGSAK